MPRTRRADRKVQLRRLQRRCEYKPAEDAFLGIGSVSVIDDSFYDADTLDASAPAPVE